MRVAKSLGVVTGAFFLVTAVSTGAEADALSCPSVLAPGQSNTYTVNSTAPTRPIDCVWGNGNLALNNNDFLDGDGVNDPGNSLVPLITEVPPDPELFNLTWSFLGSTIGWNNGPTSAVSGLTFSGSTNNSTNFAINPALAGGFVAYALGIKDGNQPDWAVFLLRNGAGLSGVASMTGGSFSHFALYGTNTPGGGQPTLQQVPEPASLLLFGSGFLLAASKVRNRLKKRS